MRLNQIGVFFLLILGVSNAFADLGWMRRETREAVRAYQFQHVSLEKSGQRAQPQEQQPTERRRGRESGLPDSSGYGAQGEHQASPPDNSRRQGRMTPEERRALRRQIDEAGHDIYTPKR